jgi:hypothetical protein
MRDGRPKPGARPPARQAILLWRWSSCVGARLWFPKRVLDRFLLGVQRVRLRGARAGVLAGRKRTASA